MVSNPVAQTMTGSGEFLIGATIGQTFSLLWRHLGRFLLIAGIACLPQLVASAFQPSAQAILQDPNQALLNHPAPNPLVGLLSFLGSVLTIFAQATIFHNVFSLLAGRDAGIGQSLRIGISRFWPLVGIGILMFLGIAAGLALLVVPGAILALMWLAASPVCVIERLGPLKSLSRSAALTKDHRWKLFGVGILLLIALIIAAGISAALIYTLGTAALAAAAVIQYALQVALTAIFSILNTVIYYNLRVAREGVGTERLAAVFE